MGEAEGTVQVTQSEGRKGMFTMPLLDALIRERQWVCPIYPRESDSAYYRRGEGCHIIVPLKGQFDTGESFYSTLLHEMAHSTGEEGLLGREKGEFLETRSTQRRNWLPN